MILICNKEYWVTLDVTREVKGTPVNKRTGRRWMTFKLVYGGGSCADPEPPYHHLAGGVWYKDINGPSFQSKRLEGLRIVGIRPVLSPEEIKEQAVQDYAKRIRHKEERRQEVLKEKQY